MEQRFEAKLSLIQVDINNRFACLQNTPTPKTNQRQVNAKCKEGNRVKILSDEVDALNVRMRNFEKSYDADMRKVDMRKDEPKSKLNKKDTGSSTPKPDGNLPWGLPPGHRLSNSILSPEENSILRPSYIFTPVQASQNDDRHEKSCEPCEPGLNDERESRTKHPEEYLQEDDDGLEDISEDDILEEITEPHAQSFLGLGRGTKLKF